MRTLFLPLLFVIVVSDPIPALARGNLKPERPRCEYLVNPLGLDEPHPRLSWIVTSGQRGARQTAYQILVAATEKTLGDNRGDLWDTGKIASDETAHVVYAGKPLAAGARAWWKVRVWDAAGEDSAWSKPAYWEAGLPSPADWHGQWIARSTATDPAPAPLLRRAFTLTGKVRRARAYVCGLGYYELSINGRAVGDRCLDPGYTRYDRRALYVTYDVTRALRAGDNALGVMLGNGWLNVQEKAAWDFDQAPWRMSPRLRLELCIELEDGSTVAVASDPSWKTADGPVTFNCIYGGESYDARRERPGWDAPAFDDSAWQPALPVDAPKGRLAAQAMPPIAVSRTLKPKSVTEPAPGVYVFDFGQNLAGCAELTLSGPAGGAVCLKYSEHLGQNGRADQGNIGVHVWKKDPTQRFQTDTYTLKGQGEEKWRARFVYHGFQYVEVTSSPVKLTGDNLRALFMHSAIEPVGAFESSNDTLDKIYRNARWAYLSNLYGIPTDCPHREKNGWTGDAHLACEQGLFAYDGAAVYTKWLGDLADEQKPTGELPGIVPTGGWGYVWGNGPAWDSAYLLIPYYLYEYCGDTRLLERHYQGHKRYVDYLTTKAKGGIVSIGLGDWAPWKAKTPAALTSTGYYYVDARIVALSARLLGRDDEAAQYEALAESIRQAFNKKYFRPDTGLYDEGTQTALACALYQGLAEPAARPLVIKNLLAAIDNTDGHIDTGILGAKYLLNTLSDAGRTDVAFRIVTQKTQPGWGWWIEQGATTLWEQWDGGASQNHIMYGDVAAWMVKSLAGLAPDPAAPGFKHVLIRPGVVDGLERAEASYDSIRGPIEVKWNLSGGKFKLDLEIPANTTATVWLPQGDPASLREDGRPLDRVDGVKLSRLDSGRPVLEVGSGKYSFTLEP